MVSGRTKNMGAWNTVRNYIDRTLDMINLKISTLNMWQKGIFLLVTGNANKHLQNKKKY